MKLLPGQVIRRVLMTEKGAQLREHGKGGVTYFLEVHPAANKLEIARAVKVVLGVDATHVRTMRVGGKPKRYGRYEGVRSTWKKAIVTLKPGQRIAQFDEV
jgi:large subunit ribosomal protein L23